MLAEGGASSVFENPGHQVDNRELRASSLAGVLLEVPARLERMRLERTSGHRERLRVERRPLDLRFELFHTRPQLRGSSHPQSLVVNHLVLRVGDLDFFGAAQQADAVDVYICISQ